MPHYGHTEPSPLLRLPTEWDTGSDAWPKPIRRLVNSVIRELDRLRRKADPDDAAPVLTPGIGLPQSLAFRTLRTTSDRVEFLSNYSALVIDCVHTGLVFNVTEVHRDCLALLLCVLASLFDAPSPEPAHGQTPASPRILATTTQYPLIAAYQSEGVRLDVMYVTARVQPTSPFSIYARDDPYVAFPAFRLPLRFDPFERVRGLHGVAVTHAKQHDVLTRDVPAQGVEKTPSVNPRTELPAAPGTAAVQKRDRAAVSSHSTTNVSSSDRGDKAMGVVDEEDEDQIETGTSSHDEYHEGADDDEDEDASARVDDLQRQLDAMQRERARLEAALERVEAERNDIEKAKQNESESVATYRQRLHASDLQVARLQEMLRAARQSTAAGDGGNGGDDARALSDEVERLQRQLDEARVLVVECERRIEETEGNLATAIEERDEHAELLHKWQVYGTYWKAEGDRATAEIAAMRAELQTVRGRRDSIAQELERARSEGVTSRSRINELEATLGHRTALVAELEQALAAARSAASVSEQALAAARRELEALREGSREAVAVIEGLTASNATQTERITDLEKANMKLETGTRAMSSMLKSLQADKDAATNRLEHAMTELASVRAELVAQRTRATVVPTPVPGKPPVPASPFTMMLANNSASTTPFSSRRSSRGGPDVYFSPVSPMLSLDASPRASRTRRDKDNAIRRGSGGDDEEDDEQQVESDGDASAESDTSTVAYADDVNDNDDEGEPASSAELERSALLETSMRALRNRIDAKEGINQSKHSTASLDLRGATQPDYEPLRERLQQLAKAHELVAERAPASQVLTKAVLGASFTALRAALTTLDAQIDLPSMKSLLRVCQSAVDIVCDKSVACTRESLVGLPYSRLVSADGRTLVSTSFPFREPRFRAMGVALCMAASCLLALVASHRRQYTAPLWAAVVRAIPCAHVAAGYLFEDTTVPSDALNLYQTLSRAGVANVGESRDWTEEEKRRLIQTVRDRLLGLTWFSARQNATAFTGDANEELLYELLVADAGARTPAGPAVRGTMRTTNAAAVAAAASSAVTPTAGVQTRSARAAAKKHA